jgi:hypothetical protein
MTIEQTVEIPASHRLTKEHSMSQTETLMKEIENLPPQYLGEVIDFVGYLKHKAVQTEDACPLCAEYRHKPNKETIAAIEEGRAMLRGEIPANQFHSAEEMWASLQTYLDSDEDE